MRVLIRKLTENMVLERDAVDRHGRLLIAAGATLTQRNLETLETSKVPVAYVEEKSYEQFRLHQEPDPLTKPEERSIRNRFRHTDLEGEFARALFEECIQRTREAKTPRAQESGTS